MKKKCTKCKKVKEVEGFSKDNRNKSGYQCCCKECQKQYRLENEDKLKSRSRKYYLEHKDERKKYRKGYVSKNRDRVSKQNKKYDLEHIEEKKKYNKKYRQKNKDKLREDKKRWYLEHKEERRESSRKYRKDNKDKIKRYREENKEEKNKYNKKYRSEHRDEINEQCRERWKTDLMFRVNESMSSLMYYSLKGNKEGLHWETLVPYKLEGLKKWLEDRFLPGMTWDNYGTKWHVDHRRPISSFSFKSHKDLQFQICWALENLRPMRGKDNLEKGSKIIEDYQMLLEI